MSNGKTAVTKKKDNNADPIRVEVRDDGVAILWMDNPGESVNTLKSSFADDFERVFSALEDDSAVRGIVLASAKKDNFIAGADITMLQKVETAADGEKISADGQRAMDRIEHLKKPVVAAIHGSCLGGGLEVALACRARIASDHKKTKLGVPEVQLGLLPGAGGTQRLPRLIGAQAALDLMLTGRQVDGRKAKKLGLVDEVVNQHIVVDVAAKHALRLANEAPRKGSPVDRIKNLFDSSELQEMALEDNPLGRKVLFDQARKKLLSKTRGNYPAPELILDAVKAGMDRGLKAGYEAERRGFGKLCVSPESKQLINIFFATQELKKDTGTKKNVKPEPIREVGMLGAGLMGAGIAYVTAARAKTPVRLKDRDNDGVLRGLKYVRDIIDGGVKRRKLTRHEADRLMSEVTGTTDYSGFGNINVVIEAVFEDIDLKHLVLREVEDATDDRTIFASNTSSLPISDIATASKHPETVIGMHYFSPVHKMPLLEIIVTKKTAPWVTATCVELGKRQGKTVIVVNDGVGFYTTRILAPFMNEAAHVLSEGVAIDKIDKALMDYGFPVGPMKLTDEVGIDVGAKVGKIMVAAFGDRLDVPEGMDKLVEDQRYGRKNKRGFYDYQGDSKKVDESVYDLLGIKPGTKMDPLEIAERCTLQMVNEAALCLQEGILNTPRDGDIGAIFGLGFPPFRGGPFRYVDAEGAKNVVAKLRRFEEKYGPRFTPAQILIDHAEAGNEFYGAEPAKPKKKKTAARSSARA